MRSWMHVSLKLYWFGPVWHPSKVLNISPPQHVAPGSYQYSANSLRVTYLQQTFIMIFIEQNVSHKVNVVMQ